MTTTLFTPTSQTTTTTNTTTPTTIFFSNLVWFSLLGRLKRKQTLNTRKKTPYLSMDSNDIHQIKSVLSTMTTTRSFISRLTQQSIKNGEKLTKIMQIQRKTQITPSQKIVLIYTLGHSEQQKLCLHRNNIWKLKIKQQHSQTSLDKKIAFDFKIKSLQVKHRQSSQKLRNNKTCCHQNIWNEQNITCDETQTSLLQQPSINKHQKHASYKVNLILKSNLSALGLRTNCILLLIP